MHGYPTEAVGLLGSLHAKDLHNVGYYAYKYINNYGYDGIMDVLNYYANNNDIYLFTINDTYNSKDMIAVTSILKQLIDLDNTTTSSVKHIIRFVKAGSDMVKAMDEHFTYKPRSRHTKLLHCRLYPTHTIMTPGNYSRTATDLRIISASNWEYYCYDSVRWNEKFAYYNATQNHVTKTITWPNDACLEAFYDNNAMDFDEQPLAVQNKSLHDICIYDDPVLWFDKMLEIAVEVKMGQMNI